MGLFVVCLMIGASSEAQVVYEDAKIFPKMGQRSDRFGNAIAMEGRTIAIGAPQHSNSRLSGSAFLFDAVTGRQLFKLEPDDGQGGDVFGSSIAISEGTVAVGAYLDDDKGEDSGSVYLFDPATGQQTHKLVPPDGHAGGYFGACVALDRGILAVGAPRDNENGSRAGAVYLYHAKTGQLIRKILAEVGAPDDFFGSAVDMSDGMLVIGAVGPYDSMNYRGAAYLFDVTTGQQRARLIHEDGWWFDRFGDSVAIDGNTIAVGAWNDFVNGEVTGAVYLFDRDSGELRGRVVPDDGQGLDNFGRRVCLGDGILGVGSTGNVGNGVDSGAVFLFDAQTGAPIVKLVASDGEAMDRLGSSVCIDAGRIAAGADGDDEIESESGSAYLFHCPIHPVLLVESSCPDAGPIRIAWSNATPSGSVVVLCARRVGAVRIPDNLPCGGTVLGLGIRELQIVYAGQTGDDGTRTIRGAVNATSCGTFLQLLDRSTCLPSNVEPVD